MSSPSVPTDLSPCQADFLDPIPRIILWRSVNLVAGASGSGKTIMLAEWAARWRDGRGICRHVTNIPTGIGVIAADRDWVTYHKAFSAAGFAEIPRYALLEDPEFNPQNWGRKNTAFTLFEQCLAQLNPQPGWIVYVDPVSPLFVQGNPNDMKDVALSCCWYRVMARKYGITLVLFSNVAKQKTEDTYKRVQDRIAGSGAWVAYTDTQISVEQDEEGILSLHMTPRNARAETHTFKFNDETKLFCPYQDPKLLAIAEDIPPHLAEALALVPEPPGTITSPDLVRRICAERGVKRTMAFKSIQQLVERKLISRDTLGVIRRVVEVLPTSPDSPTPSPTVD